MLKTCTGRSDDAERIPLAHPIVVRNTYGWGIGWTVDGDDTYTLDHRHFLTRREALAFCREYRREG